MKTLEAALEYRRMSQTELAKRVGVTSAAISNYCLGLRTPNDEIIKKIEKALNLSIREYDRTKFLTSVSKRAFYHVESKKKAIIFYHFFYEVEEYILKAICEADARKVAEDELEKGRLTVEINYDDFDNDNVLRVIVIARIETLEQEKIRIKASEELAKKSIVL